MNWKLMVVVGAAVGGVFWTAFHRTRRPADPDGWAHVTDPVPPA